MSEGVRLGLDKEIAPDGTYLEYFPFGAMIERPRMTPYHKKLKFYNALSSSIVTVDIHLTLGIKDNHYKDITTI